MTFACVICNQQAVYLLRRHVGNISFTHIAKTVVGKIAVYHNTKCAFPGRIKIDSCFEAMRFIFIQHDCFLIK